MQLEFNGLAIVVMYDAIEEQKQTSLFEGAKDRTVDPVVRILRKKPARACFFLPPRLFDTSTYIVQRRIGASIINHH